jgi:hypothetical protein
VTLATDLLAQDENSEPQSRRGRYTVELVQPRVSHIDFKFVSHAAVFRISIPEPRHLVIWPGTIAGGGAALSALNSDHI